MGEDLIGMQEREAETMAKLVAFYSRAGENYFGGIIRSVSVGNTEKVAKKIASLTGADLFKIEQEVPYSEKYNVCIAQAKQDLQANARPVLVSWPDSIEKYDEIYLGYPNYWGAMPMAVYTFLERYDWSGKTIHPFCTNEGSGLSGTEREIARAAKGAKVASGLALNGSRVDQAESQIKAWLKIR